MPRVIIIGGPNGAGKTTFASAYLSIDREITAFVNAASRSVGRLMSKYLDKRKVEQAFKRAARAVSAGSRDARAGRFVAQGAKPKSGLLTPNKAARKNAGKAKKSDEALG